MTRSPAAGPVDVDSNSPLRAAASRRQRLRVWAKHPAILVVLTSLIGQFATVITGPLLVRMLGVSARGELAITYSVVLFASQIGMLGMPAAVTYFVARDRLSARAFLARFARQYLVLSVIVAGVTGAGLTIGVWAGFRLSSPVLEIVTVALGVLVFMWMFATTAGLAGEHRFRQVAVARLVAPLAFLAAVLAMFAIHYHGAITLPLALNMAAWLGTGLMAYVLLAPRRAPVADETPVARHDVVSYGIRSVIGNAMPVDGLSIDQIILGFMASHRDLGLYAIGYAFESLPVLVLIGLATIIGPQTAAIADPRARRAFAWRAMAASAVIAAVTCAGVEVVVHPVLVAIFGSASAPAVPLARILVVGGLFLGLRRVGAATLQGLGYPELSTIAEGIGTGALLVGLVVLTAFAGRTGTAWALSGAGLVVVLIQLHYLRGIDDTQPL